MVKFLAGLKGGGKTRRLIDMANENVTVTDGHLVFIDDDKRHIHELHRDIRFVETEKGLLANYREFVGFILGILSQNNDITHIYVDGLSNIIGNICEITPETEDLIKLKKRLDVLFEKENVGFTISMHCNVEDLPAEIKAALVE
ncbi:MAG: hypothetical protein FWG38_02410 [Defluviitaleaceae bacterium]|nr:hypothetical protein [Defluviitaleaceae bacterium]